MSGYYLQNNISICTILLSFCNATTNVNGFPLKDCTIRCLPNKAQLTEKELTFFIAHTVIDEKHADDVNNAIDHWVTTDEEKEAVKIVEKQPFF